MSSVMENRGNIWSRVGLLFSVMLVIFGLSYVFHPEARRNQKQMVEELKALPLPPGTSEQSFSSGYQPSKGSALRTILSAASAQDLCGFFLQTLTSKGWHLVEQSCFSGEWGHAMMVLRKGMFTCKLVYVRQNGSTGMFTYELLATWPS